MKVYEPLVQKDPETGLFYKEWIVAEGLPLADSLITIAPPEDFNYPKWNYSKGVWEEDSDSIIEYLKRKVDELENAVLEILDNKGA